MSGQFSSQDIILSILSLMNSSVSEYESINQEEINGREEINQQNNTNPFYNILFNNMENMFQDMRSQILDDFDDYMVQYAMDASLREVPIELKTEKYKCIKDNDDICNKETCSICLENYNDDSDVCILKCKHMFHRDCIKSWLKVKRNCPYCKTDL